MRLRATSALLATTLVTTAAADAPQVGQVHELRLQYKSSGTNSEGGSSSSSGNDGVSERTVAVRDGGIEYEYDLPAGVPAQDRQRYWQFPARVFQPADGPLQLLNRAELERRLTKWLADAKIDRAMCGRWYFTWNAFQIECDPDTVLTTIGRFRPWPAAWRAGALYRDPRAEEAVPLKPKPGANGLTATLAIDPDAVRRERAQSDLITAEISGKPPPSREDALRAHAKDNVSGTITVTFEADTAGEPRRMTRVTTLTIKESDGTSNTDTTTETLERRLVPPARP